MNMKNIFSILLIAFAIQLFSQTPQGFNYSAVARDASGKALANRNIAVQMSILKGSVSGTVQYSENHSLTTDAYGLFNLVVGNGVAQSGNLATINWGADNYFLKTALDANGGTNFLTMGTTQLLSVPYALHAKKSDNGLERISTTGDTLFLTNGNFIVIGNNSNNGNNSGSLVMPTIVTKPITGITSNSATLGGTISNAQNHQITERGIVYSTSPNPTINSNKIIIGSGIGFFDVLTDYILSSNITYFVRAYAITENNIPVYGNELSFTTLSVGQNGSGGGIVFFDKGIYSDGWRYLEVSLSDQSAGIPWGCDTVFFNTSTQVGTGNYNTILIVNGCNESDFSAKLCNDLVLGGQSDWFLPSIGEVNLIFFNSINSLIDLQNAFYWTSCSDIQSQAYCFYGPQGMMPMSTPKNQLFSVRAIRAY
jgi:hypothetical protein